jgi:hypothetical protein
MEYEKRKINMGKKNAGTNNKPFSGTAFIGVS